MTTHASIDRGLLILRVALGSVFVAHGAQKLFGFGLSGTAGFLGSLGIPLPEVNAAALIGVELVGGLALLAGMFTRVAAALVSSAMLVAVAVVHLPNGYFLPNGVEFALTLMLASLAVTFTGPGRYSIDARLGGRPAGSGQYEHPIRRAA